jgi:phosphoglycerate dehydrogenase-like enzyme
VITRPLLSGSLALTQSSWQCRCCPPEWAFEAEKLCSLVGAIASQARCHRQAEPGMRLQPARIDLRLAVVQQPTQDALAATLPGANAVIIVGEQPVLTADMICTATRLRLAASMGAATDNLDIGALTQRRIPPLTTGSSNAAAVADRALYPMPARAKRRPARSRLVQTVERSEVHG